MSSASELTGESSPAALLQWVIRFVQTPEALPVFIAWCKSIWPEMPYSEAEIMADLVGLHDKATSLLALYHEAERTGLFDKLSSVKS